MSEAEREAFLADVHVGVLSVERPERGPLTIPIWYDYEPGGEVKILTGPDTLKARLLARAGRFSLCAQSEAVPYRYVTVEGPIVETRQADIETDSRVMAHRYLGAEMGDRYIGNRDESTSICISMRPDRWHAIDYGKAGSD